jgi:L-2-hydroxyglutarate oxidase LhgO
MILSRGGGIVYKTPFHQAKITSQGFEIHLGGIESAIVNSKCLINAAGLSAVGVAKHIEGIANNLIP